MPLAYFDSDADTTDIVQALRSDGAAVCRETL